jgi:hypothetical protein
VKAIRAQVEIARADVIAASRWPNPRVTYDRESVAGVTEGMTMIRAAAANQRPARVRGHGGQRLSGFRQSAGLGRAAPRSGGSQTCVRGVAGFTDAVKGDRPRQRSSPGVRGRASTPRSRW